MDSRAVEMDFAPASRGVVSRLSLSGIDVMPGALTIFRAVLYSSAEGSLLRRGTMTSRALHGDPVVDRHGEARICIDHGFVPGQALLDGRIILRAWNEFGSPIAPAEFLARCHRVLRERATEYPDSRLASRFRRSRALARETSIRVRSVPMTVICRAALRRRSVRARGIAARRARTRPAALARDGDGDPPGPKSETFVAAPVALLNEGGAP